MKPLLIVVTGAALAVVAVAAEPVCAGGACGSIKPAAADGSVRGIEPNSAAIQAFQADGFRADPSSPLTLQGDLLGTNAIWQTLVGPVRSNSLATLPAAAAAYDGGGCVAEYSQNQITADDGSTLTLSVYGLRCEPYSPSAVSAGAHTNIGMYSVLSGTGRFEAVSGGTGSIAFDSRADGSTAIHIGGFLTARSAGQSAPRAMIGSATRGAGTGR